MEKKPIQRSFGFHSVKWVWSCTEKRNVKDAHISHAGTCLHKAAHIIPIYNLNSAFWLLIPDHLEEFQLVIVYLGMSVLVGSE